jgi:hypothetical protein
MHLHSPTLWLVAGYFCFLLLTLVYRSRIVAGPWLFLLRSFFPNWRFFHQVGHVAVLTIRVAVVPDQWQDWQLMTPRAARKWQQLLHNPAVNLALSNQNLVEHLSADIQAAGEEADCRQWVTYQMLSRLVRHSLTQTYAGQSLHAYQFRVHLVPPFETVSENTVLLSSPIQGW